MQQASERASGRAGLSGAERARWLYKVKGRLTLTLKFVLFNAETDKLRYLISFTTITRERFIGRRYRPEAQMRVTCSVVRRTSNSGLLAAARSEISIFRNFRRQGTRTSLYYFCTLSCQQLGFQNLKDTGSSNSLCSTMTLNFRGFN